MLEKRLLYVKARRCSSMPLQIFELYMLASSQSSEVPVSALGMLDPSSELLELDFDLLPPELASMTLQTRKSKPIRPVSISATIHQSISKMRSGRGDTSSAVWRISLALAKELLTAHHFPTLPCFFDLQALKESRVLELGSGCGRA
jgi:hypothetical protein